MPVDTKYEALIVGLDGLLRLAYVFGDDPRRRGRPQVVAVLYRIFDGYVAPFSDGWVRAGRGVAPLWNGL